MRLLYVVPVNILLFIVKIILWVIGRVILVLAMPFHFFCSIIGFFANLFVIIVCLVIGSQLFGFTNDPDFSYGIMIFCLILFCLFKYLCDVGGDGVMEIGYFIIDLGSDIDYLPKERIYIDNSLTEEEKMANIERHLETIYKYSRKKEYLANDSENLEK